jgi:predicted Zn-dependent protease
MPGGKIVVYSGILPYKDDAGLATVMGHEVSRLANHGAQRMSAAQLQGLGAVGCCCRRESAETQQTWQQIYGVGSQVGVCCLIVEIMKLRLIK